MSFVQTQWWQLELPEEWEAEQEDEMILIGDCDGVGEIAITTLEKEQGEVDDEELRAFAEDLPVGMAQAETVRLADQLQGYYFCYREQGDYVREWYLRSGGLMLLITYSCDEGNAAMDDAAVDEILDTLALKLPESED